ncbi:MAG: hypothetical protein ACLGIT_06125 [Gammaproteobacteria bacterium]|uniref:hypothetical protein n=1 Tax=Azohydromonas sp. TaxID=1872666 RepID=UPI002C63558C|nr:hypothetical protein [Azohydromonas sp.]HMM85255.1 hypothetical protein [Azohydromonas sp.]
MSATRSPRRRTPPHVGRRRVAGGAAWRTALLLAGVAVFAAIALVPVLAPSPYGVAPPSPPPGVDAARSPLPSADTGFSAAYRIDWREVEVAPNPAPLAVAAYDE